MAGFSKLEQKTSAASNEENGSRRTVRREGSNGQPGQNGNRDETSRVYTVKIERVENGTSGAEDPKDDEEGVRVAEARDVESEGEENGVEALDPPLAGTPIQWSEEAEKFRVSIKGLLPGSPEFMKLFVPNENGNFAREGNEVKVHDDGICFNLKLEDFQAPHFFKKMEGLGMVVPEDLSFATLARLTEKILDKDVGVIKSETGELDEWPLRKLIEKLKVDEKDRKEIINSVTIEFSNEDIELNKNFQLPRFVVENNMVEELEKKLKGKNDRVSKKWIEEMPRYAKFLIVSMAGSYMDAHIDFSGTGVYYHVVVGRKIFYLVKNTDENRKIFMDHRERGDPRWVGDVFYGGWERQVIDPGETIFIPPGYIHIVYTPQDSIVLAGNFMLELFSRIHFEVTKFEERCLPEPENGKPVNETALFEGYWNFIRAYTKVVLSPKIRESKGNASGDLIQLGQMFLTEIREGRAIQCDWFTPKTKAAIVRSLRTQLAMAIRRTNHRDALSVEHQDDGPPGKKANPESAVLEEEDVRVEEDEPELDHNGTEEEGEDEMETA